MIQVPELVADRAAAFAGQVRKARKNSVASARSFASGSADSIKSFKTRLRQVSRSGVKLTSVSQAFSQNLIEFQTDVVSAAMSELALRLERASRADSIVELLREQVELVPATRARITSDAQRAAQIFRSAGRDIRAVATQAFERIVEKGGQTPAAAAPVRRRARKTARKPGRARKAA